MRIKNSINNILTGLVGQLILTITGFITRTVFINILGSTYLGVSGLFSNILTVLSFAELGVGQAIVFSLYKPIAEEDEEKICSLMRLYSKIYHILFLVVLALGLLILPFLPYIIKDIDSIPNIRIIYVMYVKIKDTMIKKSIKHILIICKMIIIYMFKYIKEIGETDGLYKYTIWEIF